MAIITFHTYPDEETGNAVSAIAVATYLGITKNKKNLLISTSFNDDTVREAFWGQQTKKRSGLFGPNTNIMSENGIEGLYRIIRSNKISPNIITDYTKVALTSRLEILLGYKGIEDQYKEIQNQYPQIINLASKFYNNVIIAIDQKINTKTKNEILELADVNVEMTTQKNASVRTTAQAISEKDEFNKIKSLITLGKYDERSKYNIKNISRNVLKQKRSINSIPYNTLLFEAVQEGQIIDMLLRFLNLKGKDENTFFIEELKRLTEDIEMKDIEVQQMKKY